MNIVTSVTFWNDAVGKRISVSYTTVDDTTGAIESDNHRKDAVVLDADVKSSMDAIATYAQTLIE